MSTREELQGLARQGDPEALFRLGLDYMQEAKTTQNLDMLSNVAHLYSQSASKGHTEAMRRLAELHTLSRETFYDADPRVALDLYRKIVQDNPKDFEAKIALGDLYCTAGFVSQRESFKLPGGSIIQRNLEEAQRLIELDVMQNANLDDLDYYNLSRLSDIYGGGWLRNDCEPTVDDTIQAIKLIRKVIDLAYIENERKEVIELQKQQLDNLKEQIKFKLKALIFAQELKSSVESLDTISSKGLGDNIVTFVKMPANENFSGDSVFEKLITHGLADIANELEKELNGEQEKKEAMKHVVEERIREWDMQATDSFTKLEEVLRFISEQEEKHEQQKQKAEQRASEISQKYSQMIKETDEVIKRLVSFYNANKCIHCGSDSFGFLSKTCKNCGTVNTDRDIAEAKAKLNKQKEQIKQNKSQELFELRDIRYGSREREWGDYWYDAYTFGLMWTDTDIDLANINDYYRHWLETELVNESRCYFMLPEHSQKAYAPFILHIVDKLDTYGGSYERYKEIMKETNYYIGCYGYSINYSVAAFVGDLLF